MFAVFLGAYGGVEIVHILCEGFLKLLYGGVGFNFDVVADLIIWRAFEVVVAGGESCGGEESRHVYYRFFHRFVSVLV